MSLPGMRASVFGAAMLTQMSVDAVLGADATRCARGRQYRQIGGQGVTRCRRMVQMAGDTAEDQGLAAHARMFEARAQLLVFGSPADDVFVESVDTQQLCAPGGQVAALDGDEAVGDPATQRGEGRQMK